MKWKIIHSLRGRYAVVTLLLSALLLAGSFFAQFNLSQNTDATTGNITTRNKLLQDSRHIRTAIREHRESLVFFLLMPNEQHSEEYLHLTLEQALKYTGRLLEHPWIIKNDKKNTVLQLEQSLHKYGESVDELIKIRKHPDKQYPSMAIAYRFMQAGNDRINNALSIALLETSEESHQVITPTYKQFVEARHHWTQMTSLFRIYLANSIGGYNAGSIPAQERAILTLYERVQHNIEKLKALNKKGTLGLQSEDALEIIQQNSTQWRRDLTKVFNIHKSKFWRADVTAIRTNIEPHNEQIWNLLQSLEIAIEAAANTDVTNLTQIAKKQVIILWVLTLFGLIFLFTGFYFLERLVLRPIAHLSQALKNEASGDSENKLTLHSHITETNNLIEAFTEMRSQVRQRQKQLEHQALHDALTGLANRTLLYDRLQYSIRTSRRENKKIALLMIDLDRFKDVNDTLGHHIGDALLVEIGQRLKDTLREADTVARLGGDEFAVLITNTTEAEATLIAKKIHTAMAEIFYIEELKLYIKASIGIVLYPKHGEDAQTLLQKSDIAMYVAKRNKLGQSVYSPQQDEHRTGRLELMSDLRSAITEDQLELHYQPITQLSTSTVIGVEALLRWQHPQHGNVSPAKIIPFAEQTGDIGAVTKWVINKVLNQLKLWEEENSLLGISVNLSVYNLYDTELINEISQLLKDNTKLCPRLTFEITESAMMEQPEQAVEVITHFSNLGVSISIDDFGTGFSSLSYLKRLPVSQLKIDKSFITEVCKNDSDPVIVRSTINLAHNLGLQVIAEGVENQDIYDILSIMECDIAQGYHISYPLPIDELEKWLKHNNS